MFVRQSNPDISNFMKKWNMTNDYHKLESIYIKKLLDIVSSYPTNNGRGGLNDPQLPKTWEVFVSRLHCLAGGVWQRRPSEERHGHPRLEGFILDIAATWKNSNCRGRGESNWQRSSSHLEQSMVKDTGNTKQLQKDDNKGKQNPRPNIDWSFLPGIWTTSAMVLTGQNTTWRNLSTSTGARHRRLWWLEVGFLLFVMASLDEIIF